MNRHVVIVAAGTGGHVMPGLALADEMRARGWTVSWIGTRTGMEKDLVRQHGIALDLIDFSGLRGKGVMGAFLGGLKLLQAMWQCVRILRLRRPAVVFGTGGYVCIPAGMMASLLGKKLVLLNADAAWLMSNRFLRSLADRIAFGFSGKDAAAGVCTGNPVRAEVAQVPVPAERFASRSGPLKVLVMGGSLGAMVLNETVPRALALIEPQQRPQVIHQAGQRHLESVRAAYAEQGLSAEVVPFIDDMASAYAVADLVICRAGAMTVSELCAAGVASVLVPLRLSTTAHQVHNAEWLAQQQACVHLPQAELTPLRLADILRSFDRACLLEMAEHARQQGKPQATQTVATVIEEVCQ
jgi:UDP-N-acetylglucosamine--N-acetylmuramyl-(pentapeptide) pyrophosphoryl-undecaprenol N-acetylglucosamine transferase